eukprot:9473064-Pyramimonas_sp.AAC.1
MPPTIVLKGMQEFHGWWGAVPFQKVALASAPRTFVSGVCNSIKAPHGWRPRHGVLPRCKSVRAQQSR